MTKEDVKKAVLTGIICGLTTVVTIYVSAFTYVKVGEWYREYERERAEKKIDSTPPDRRSGSFCPKCKSKDVGRYVYGYWEPYADSVTAQAVRSGLLIGGGCAFDETYPKYKCNRCNYKWGNFK